VPIVRDIMRTDVPTVSPTDSVERVFELLRGNSRIGLPVVNEGGRCVGIVTEADLVIADDERDLHLPHMISLFGGVVFLEPLSRFEDRLRKAAAAQVADLMTPDPVTVDFDADVREAGRLMAKHDHDQLPVAEHGRYVGVVTRLDVLEALTRE